VTSLAGPQYSRGWTHHAARHRLITEALQAGQRIEGIEIVDPFA
jgi:hypothetical protein